MIVIKKFTIEELDTLISNIESDIKINSTKIKNLEETIKDMVYAQNMLKIDRIFYSLTKYDLMVNEEFKHIDFDKNDEYYHFSTSVNLTNYGQSYYLPPTFTDTNICILDNNNKEVFNSIIFFDHLKDLLSVKISFKMAFSDYSTDKLISFVPEINFLILHDGRMIHHINLDTEKIICHFETIIPNYDYSYDHTIESGDLNFKIYIKKEDYEHILKRIEFEYNTGLGVYEKFFKK